MEGSERRRPVEPFEICSIRPPTENTSLTFRLTRNCGWNKCSFCPVYKTGERFSRRSIEEIMEDVDRARYIDDLVSTLGTGPGRPVSELSRQIAALAETEREQDRVRDDNNQADWFSSWFKETPSIRESIDHVYAWRLHGGQTAFLGDADTLSLKPEFFAQIMDYIRERFPSLRRFTGYGRTRSAVRKGPEALGAFAKAGLNRLHFGIESGSDRVLASVSKGETADDHIRGCHATRQAGISPSVYIMPGLGGAAWSDEHAHETARVLTEIRPDYVRIRTLEIFPGTPLAEEARNGRFREATEERVVEEIRTIVKQTDSATTIVSDSASNLLDVSGHLPEDRGRMLAVIDDYLSLSPREKLEFSLISRLQSFAGQYGGITNDIAEPLLPYIHSDRIETSSMPDSLLHHTIRLIRSRLMP